MSRKRINIFTGHFGSGKSEVAVNFAVNLKKEHKKVAIVDLDIVNPFFRSADVRDQLEKLGIEVIAPLYANTNVDVPALSPEINRIFEDKEFEAVFDIGGEDLGARVLSRYLSEITDDSYELFCVINLFRPMTNTVDKIDEMIKSIEFSSRLKITSLINNTNLLGATTIEHILQGRDAINEISEKLNIPIGLTSGFKNILEGHEALFKGRILYLDKLLKLPWE